MKKRIFIWFTAVMILVTATVSAVPTQNNEAYMGFAVPNDWIVLSKNMEDTQLLDKAGITADEVNQTLANTGSEYLMIHPKSKREINVKIEDNDISKEFFNIFETKDEEITEQLDRILEEGFLVDKFDYYPEDVTVTEHAQMKFVTVPGSVQGKGILFGFTFVNGKGISFIMYLETSYVGDEDKAAFSEIVNTVEFTDIRKKDEPTPAPAPSEAPAPVGGLPFIVGGIGALLVVLVCVALIVRVKNAGSRDLFGEDDG